jgi:ankyrin repeat protein
MAIASKSLDLVQLLIDAGADKDVACPLIVAICSGQYDLAEKLLKLGANANGGGRYHEYHYICKPESGTGRVR